ncbi:MAG: MlaD family protein [Sulfurovum sp.]|nr:MlaD family protein [Sulfurovum sp.]
MSQDIPKVKVSNKFNLLTSIWIVPFIAMLIAGWLAYQYFEDLGAEIEIVFARNEGLIAGQSVVKFKNVPIGKVTKIYLKQDIDGVVVRVRMYSKASKPYLSEYAKFWIVKPEVGFSGISGLDTIISGTYIDIYSKEGGTFKENHLGLTVPYQDTSQGKYYHLLSEKGKNISVGMPVFYKNIQVGKVQYKYLSLDYKHIEIILFIDNEYTSYIHQDSKFWIKNAMSLDFSKGKFDLDIAPLNFLLTGGIVFDSSGDYHTQVLSKRATFVLHDSETIAKSHVLGAIQKEHRLFVLLTQESIAGLSEGSLVRFEGFDIGKVVNMKLSYSKKTHKMLGEVLVKIDTSVFQDHTDKHSTGEDNLYLAVKEGLRAKITDLDPITGAQFVDLTFEYQDKAGTLGQRGQYVSLPMSSQSAKGIMAAVTEILDTLNTLPLDALLASVTEVIEASKVPIATSNTLLHSLLEPVENANTLLLSLQKSVEDINRLTRKEAFHVMPDELNKVLREMTKTLKETSSVVKGYDSNSLVKEQLTQTLEILSQTSAEMQFFLRMLNRKPNSLIFGDN